VFLCVGLIWFGLGVGGWFLTLGLHDVDHSLTSTEPWWVSLAQRKIVLLFVCLFFFFRYDYPLVFLLLFLRCMDQRVGLGWDLLLSSFPSVSSLMGLGFF
jgi:hypothetical protein